MTTGSPTRLLFSFALPLMFGNIFQQLYTIVDTAIVGQGVGMLALAALGTVDWLNWMMLGIAQGFTQGFCIRMAQKFGARDEEGLKQTLGTSILLTAIVAAAGTLISQLGLPVFLKLMQVPTSLVPSAIRYSRIIMGGFAAVCYLDFEHAQGIVHTQNLHALILFGGFCHVFGNPVVELPLFGLLFVQSGGDPPPWGSEIMPGTDCDFE
jgi:Na+-driven multidrug efflux pump